MAPDSTAAANPGTRAKRGGPPAEGGQPQPGHAVRPPLHTDIMDQGEKEKVGSEEAQVTYEDPALSICFGRGGCT